MTEATRRERLRAETERDIRRTARALLVERGADAVTLRAIARAVGITAPALYRYYDSREDLLARLCDDICGDLDRALSAELDAQASDDVPAQVFAVGRRFRKWALAHPSEFALVFASTDGRVKEEGDQFGKIFLQLAAGLVAAHPFPKPVPEDVPESLEADLRAFQHVMIETVRERGVEIDEDVLHLGAIYHILQSWVRLYGHVALEVFGRFPFVVSNPEAMFDRMLGQMLGELSLTHRPDRP
ncbi:TetR/AcrR family transcriptional regulator [Actinosynnema sp. NPDC020468]|uniref:TetR/AcrR family transcriptional regulator n=1 Tax=Actinosynnema sp. NPDC020468 TaxID=3154488 RepID=UPI0033FF5A2F